MKKKQKGLFIALICLFAAVVLYVVILKVNQAAETAEADGETDDEMIISSADSDQIDAISYETDGQSLSFVKENDVWYYETDKNFPVAQEDLTDMANELAAISASRKIEEPEDLSEYGLDTPLLTVHYETAEGESGDIAVGDTNSAVSGCYLQLANDTAVYLVDSGFADAFIDDLYEMADMENFPTITSDSITGIRVESEEHSLELTTSGDSSTGWLVKENEAEQEDCSSSAITQFINTVTGIAFKSHVDYNCADMSQYGLDSPKAAITVDYTEEVTVESETEDDAGAAADTETSTEAETAGDADTTGAESNMDAETAETEANTDAENETKADTETENETEADTETEEETEAETVQVARQAVVYIGGQNDDGDYYVSMDGSKEVHILSADTAEELMTQTAFDMTDSSILSGTLSSAKAMDITIGEDHWQLEKWTVEVADETEEAEASESEESTTDTGETEETEETEVETEDVWYLGDTEIELTDLSSVYSDLSSMEAEKILEEAVTPAENPSMEIVITWEDDTQTKISFSEYDSSFQLATVNGQSRKLVNRRDVEKFIEDLQALFQD